MHVGVDETTGSPQLAPQLTEEYTSTNVLVHTNKRWSGAWVNLNRTFKNQQEFQKQVSMDAGDQESLPSVRESQLEFEERIE